MDDIVANRTVKIRDFTQLMGYRKIAMLTFMLNQKIGGFSPVSYRIVNILIHIINSILVFFIAFRTLNNLDRRDISFTASFLAGILFGLHPININAVTYIVQRMTSLATLFVLLSILFYSHGRTTSKRSVSLIFLILSGISLTLGILTKENAILGIPLIGLYDLFFLKTGRREMLIRGGITALVLLAAGAFLMNNLDLGTKVRDFVEIFTTHFNKPVSGYDWMAKEAGWSPKEHILTEFRILSRYLGLIVLPLPSRFVFDWWGFPLSHGLTAPPSTLVGLVFLTGLILFALLGRKRFPFLSFGILWYFLAISLESFIAVGSDLYFEHRNYLPMTGLSFGLMAESVLFFKKRYPRLLETRELSWIAAIVIISVLGGFTIKRNMVFRDSITLWSDTVRKAGENLRARVALGNAYLKESRLDDAIRVYEESVRKGLAGRSPAFFTDAAYNLGMMYLTRSDLDKAGRIISILDRLTTPSWQINVLKGLYLQKKGDLPKALDFFEKAEEYESPFAKTLVNTMMGDTYLEGGLPEEARRHYKKALAIDPKFSSAYYGLAQIALRQNRPEEGERLLRKALEYDPANVLALADLSDLMLIKGKTEKALELARHAVLRSPPLYQPYISMGNVLYFMGYKEKAEKFYDLAFRNGAEADLVIFSKVRVLILKGERNEAKRLLQELLKRKDTSDRMRNVIRNAYDSL
jgi:tetratricopeptide (TPR) repeat protein